MRVKEMVKTNQFLVLTHKLDAKFVCCLKGDREKWLKYKQTEMISCIFSQTNTHI